jgi:hypothetical protein
MSLSICSSEIKQINIYNYRDIYRLMTKKQCYASHGLSVLSLILKMFIKCKGLITMYSIKHNIAVTISLWPK